MWQKPRSAARTTFVAHPTNMPLEHVHFVVHRHIWLFQAGAWTVTSLLLVILCGCAGANHTRLPQLPEDIAHEFDGGEDVVVVFMDFACPECETQSRQLEELLRIHENARLRFYFVPSTRRSLKLSEVVVCAGDRALQAQVALTLFRAGSISQDHAISIAARLGADAEALARCVNTPSTINGLLEDVNISRRLGVSGLPTLFIHQDRFEGVSAAEVLSQNIIGYR